MSDPQDTGARSRFVINLVGVVGIVFGVLPIVRYLLELSFFEFTVAPYEWLQARGGRAVPAPGDGARRVHRARLRPRAAPLARLTEAQPSTVGDRSTTIA